MKQVKMESISFKPILQVHDVGDGWAVSFDSGLNRDLTRASRTVFVLRKGIKQLEVKVEGFTKLTTPAAVDESSTARGAPSIDGRILLVATYRDNIVDNCVLAECAFTPWVHHKGTAPVDDVARAVRNGTTDAFTAALPDLFADRIHQLQEKYEAAPSAPQPVMRGRIARGRSFGQSAQANRLQRWKPWLAVGGVVVGVWVLLSIFGKPAHSPEQQAIAATNPNVAALQLPQATGADAQAQVELVKQTLKSMGLDPGASGDTGCLVQPQ